MSKDIGDSKLIDVWAGSGLAVTPDVSKIEGGWLLGEQPPHEWMNWIHKTLGEKVNHMLANGVAKWDNETPYPVGATAQHAGFVWIAQVINTNSEPTDPNANWRKIATTADIAAAINALPSSSVAATADTLMLRDSAGRSKVVAGAATDDVANVGQVAAFGFAQVFSAVGVTNWTVPDALKNGLVRAHVTVVGGGGGGNVGPASGQRGAGGGAGGAGISFALSLEGINSINVTIGGGGSGGGAMGGSGGTSSFGAFISATGGIGAGFSDQRRGGSPGASSSEVLSLSGGFGSDSPTTVGTDDGGSGDGGASLFGGGGRSSAASGIEGAADRKSVV